MKDWIKKHKTKFSLVVVFVIAWVASSISQRFYLIDLADIIWDIAFSCFVVIIIGHFIWRPKFDTVTGQPLPSSSSTKEKIIKWAVIIIVIVLLTAGCNSFMGGQKETVLILPDILTGSQIQFDKLVYVQIGSPQQGTKTFKKISRQIVVDQELSDYYPNRFTYEAIPLKTRFDVIGAINEAQYGFSSVDAGTRGVDYLILQDEQGVQYFVADFNFGELDLDRHNASVYKGGIKVGEIDLDE